jgi:hypothetical protein
MKDYYSIIGIAPSAGSAEIKQAFRRLAVSYHPDKNPSPDAEEQFKEINEAYEVLNNPAKRAAYDELRANPFQSTYEAQPQHRDPAYNRNRYAYYQATHSHQTPRELMAEYLPKFRWICWAGLVLTTSLAIDFLLPRQETKEDVVEIKRIFRTGRYGGAIYDHDLLITSQGSEVMLFNDDLLRFKDEPWVIINKTALFSKIVSTTTEAQDYQVTGASVYSSLAFMPLILFLTSLLGVSIRKKVEFPFNLTIVSGIFFIIVLYLIIA